MEKPPVVSAKYLLKARIQEFNVPPIRDGLVLGKDAPIGCMALRKACKLLGDSRLAHVQIEDDIISDIFVRHAILRLIPKATLIDFVIRQVKPLMGTEDILHLVLEAEVLIEGET